MRAIGQRVRTPSQGGRLSVPHYHRSRPRCRYATQTQQLPGIDGRVVQQLPDGGSIIFHWDPLTLTLSTVTVSTTPPATAVEGSSSGSVLSDTQKKALGASIGAEATSSATIAPAVATPTTSTAAAPTATATSSSSSPPTAKATTTAAAATTSSPPAAAATSASSKPKPVLSGTPTTPSGGIDWEARRKLRTAQEVQELASKRGIPCTLEAVMSGLQQLEDLVPGFKVNLETLKAQDWASLALDTAAAAAALVALKAAYPGADMAAVITVKPGLMLQSPELLAANATQVRTLLATAKDLDALITALPVLTDPAVCISILVTVKKWYHTKGDPVLVLEADPDLVLRAEACDTPFEPVYGDISSGNWMAPSLANYAEKRADWQAYIEKNVYKQDDGMPGSG